MTQIVSGETWAAITCDRFPWKVMYGSADEASLHLRQFAVALMERGRSADALTVFPCVGNGWRHFHLGRMG